MKLVSLHGNQILKEYYTKGNTNVFSNSSGYYYCPRQKG